MNKNVILIHVHMDKIDQETTTLEKKILMDGDGTNAPYSWLKKPNPMHTTQIY
jgi:hypothetical protein